MKGVFVSPGEAARALRPIESVSLHVDPTDILTAGDVIELSAEVDGGEPRRLYLFFHRIGDGQFEVIQDWSPRNRARWTVGECERSVVLTVFRRGGIPCSCAEE